MDGSLATWATANCFFFSVSQVDDKWNTSGLKGGDEYLGDSSVR